MRLEGKVAIISGAGQGMGAWAFQINWQSFSRAVVSMASSRMRGDRDVPSRKYRANSSPRFATSGALNMMDPGPCVGTPPRCCTSSSNVVRWSSGTCSLVTVGVRAMLSSLLIVHLDAGAMSKFPSIATRPEIYRSANHPHGYCASSKNLC